MKTTIAAAVLLLFPGVADAQDAASASFCTRMATQFGMTATRPVDGKAAFQARALKGLGAALFGGSATVTMMLKPPVSGDIGDPARYATACGVVANGLGCRVSGPAVFEMAVRDTVATIEARAGEVAQVSMARNRIRCEDR